MRVNDNRHLDYRNILQHGDVIRTNCGRYYQFVLDYDEDADFPYLLVDINKGRVIDKFSKSLFDRLSIGSYLEEDEAIEEITKHKNLVLELR